MRVLITGGAGFLGAWITRRLIRGGHEVRIFDRTPNPALLVEIAGPEAAAVAWIEGDIRAADAVARAAEGCDGVVHLAALLTPACREAPILGLDVNVAGTINVFEAVRHGAAGRVVYASSAGVFGPDDGLHPMPATLYGVYKLACEGIGRCYADDYGVASVGFRPLVVYGPGREVGSTAGVTLACRHAVAGSPYTIPFTGETDLIFVDDVAAAFEAAVAREVRGAHALTLVGEVARIDDVIAAIAAECPGARIDAAGPPVPIAARLAASDVAAVLGALPSTPLADGLRQTLDFYRRAA